MKQRASLVKSLQSWAVVTALVTHVDWELIDADCVCNIDATSVILNDSSTFDKEIIYLGDNTVDGQNNLSLKNIGTGMVRVSNNNNNNNNNINNNSNNNTAKPDRPKLRQNHIYHNAVIAQHPDRNFKKVFIFTDDSRRR